MKILPMMQEGSSLDSLLKDRLQKIKSREQFRTKDENNIDENEKW